MKNRHSEGTGRVLYAALAGNLLVALAKFAAAAITSSAAMLSEGVHSLIDTSNEVLMLYGRRRAQRAPDERHPLGYGREVYFWSFVVSLLVFVVGAGVSVAGGLRQLLNPHPLENPIASYAVLGLAALLEGASWWIAMREFRRRKGKMGYLEAAQATKDPSTAMVFFEDSAALAGIAIALAGTMAAYALEDPRYDGAASIAIGLVLAAVATFLARENKRLLIGEGPHPALERAIAEFARAEPGVERFNGLLAIQLAPNEVAAVLSLDFEDDLDAGQLGRRFRRLEERIREAHPEVILISFKLHRPEDYAVARRRWRATREDAA